MVKKGILSYGEKHKLFSLCNYPWPFQNKACVLGQNNKSFEYQQVLRQVIAVAYIP